MTSAASQNRDLHWLRRNLPDDAHVIATDVTSAYAVLALMGREPGTAPAADPADLSSAAFPFAVARDRTRLRAGARAAHLLRRRARFELHIPTEFAGPVFDLIAEAAGDRLALAGFHALDSLRLEKAYRHWGHDLTDEDTPLEAGLGFACAFAKAIPFIGRDALLAESARRLVQFRLLDPEPLLFHNEPIVMDGRPAHIRLLRPHARRRDRHAGCAIPTASRPASFPFGPFRDRSRRRALSGRSKPAPSMTLANACRRERPTDRTRVRRGR